MRRQTHTQGIERGSHHTLKMGGGNENGEYYSKNAF